MLIYQWRKISIKRQILVNIQELNPHWVTMGKFYTETRTIKWYLPNAHHLLCLLDFPCFIKMLPFLLKIRFSNVPYLNVQKTWTYMLRLLRRWRCFISQITWYNLRTSGSTACILSSIQSPNLLLSSSYGQSCARKENRNVEAGAHVPVCLTLGITWRKATCWG